MNPRTCLPVVAFLLLASTIGVVASRAQAPGARGGDSASNLRNIGQAIMMYANDHKGHVPPDLGKLAKYLDGNLDVLVSPRRVTLMPDDVRAKPEASAEWFNTWCDYVLTVPPGTRQSRIRMPSQFPLVVEKPSLQDEGTIAVLYADGHVVEYARRAPGARTDAAIAPAPAAAASRPAPMVPASAPLPNADEVVGKFPENLAAALAGSWRLTDSIDATYTFNPDGMFTLAFQNSGDASGEASGTWKLNGKRLIMTNTVSNTPFTIVGEQEDAEIAGLTGNALALRTTNRKGAEELLLFARIVPFAKGKHDNAKVVGTWQADNLLLVLAESGMFDARRFLCRRGDFLPSRRCIDRRVRVGLKRSCRIAL